MASGNRAPSTHFTSQLSLNSTRDDKSMPMNERTKLVLLIRAWRAKFEKAQAASRQHTDYIKVLETDIKRLQEEKIRVTNDLTMKLERTQEEGQAQIKKLELEAQTARNEPEIEARYLRRKLERLQNETQPIVEYYKKRDLERITKTEEMRKTIDELQSDLSAMQEIHRKEMEESNEKLQAAENEVDELKERYVDQIEKVKKHCAAKILEARQEMEERAEKEATSSISEVFQKYEALQQQIETQITKNRVDLEEKHQERLKKMAEDYEEKLQEESKQQVSKIRELEKRIRISEANSSNSKSIKGLVEKSLAEATEKLKTARHLYYNSVFWEFDGKMKKNEIPVACSANLRDLLSELASRQRELREMKQRLDRYDQDHLLENIEQDQIQFEIDFNIKATEIEYVRKLIRMKRVQSQSIRKVPMPKKNYREKPFTIMVHGTVLPENVPGNDENKAEANKLENVTMAKKVREKKKTIPEEESRRDKWLYRQPSTVQLYPAINGRQQWRDNEIKGIFN